MLRATLTALILTALPMATALAETKDERAARCAAQSEIVARALELRRDGKRENRAIRTISKERADHATPYTTAISPLAGWVYALPADALETDVAAQFTEACTGFTQ